MQFGQLKRRDFIILLGGGAAASWPLAARAQQPDRMRRIGVLMSFALNDPEAQSRVAAFEHRLRELGWVVGRNLRIEYRWADNDDVLRTYATELIGMEPDLILASGTPIMAALQKQRHSVPIVFTQVTDPIGQGLVSNLAHPGGHLTGFTSFEFSIGTKWLETLKEVAPRVTRVALIFNPHTAPFADLFWRPVEAAAPSFAVVPTLARRAQFCRARGYCRCVRARAEWRPDGAAGCQYVKLSRRNHWTCRTPPPAGGLPVPSICRERWPAVIWYGSFRCLSARGYLCRPYPQGRETG